MQSETQVFKGRFTLELTPFFDMLTERLDGMDSREWLRLVENIRLGITRNPEQYIGSDRPEAAITSSIIEEIFAEFLETHALVPLGDLIR